MATLVPLENLPPEARAGLVPGSDAFKAYATDYEGRMGLPAGALSNATFKLKPGTDPLSAFKASAYLHKNLPADRTGANLVPTADEERTGKYRAPIDSPDYSPLADMNFGERALAGAGMSVHNSVQGLGQAAGLVSQEDVDESRRLDAPLNDTAGGMTGNMIGTAVQAALPAGAVSKGVSVLGKVAPTLAKVVSGPVAQALITGGGYGAAQPVASGESRGTNAALDAAAGGLGAIVPAAVKGLGTAAKASAAPAVAELSDLAAKIGVKLRAAQVSTSPYTKWATSILDNIPFLNNTAKLSDAQKTQLSLAMSRTMGSDSPDALAALREARGRLSPQFDQINLNNNVQVEPWHVDEMNQIVKDFKASSTTPEEAALGKRLDIIRNNLVNHTDANGVIDGPKYQSIRTSLGDATKGADGTSRYRSSVDQLKGVLDKAFDSGLSPADMEKKNLLRQQWSNMKTLEQVAPSGPNDEFDLKKLTSILNARNAGNSANRNKIIYGAGDQDLADVSRVGSQFISAGKAGSPMSTGNTLVNLGKKSISPAAVGTSLYALNHDEQHPLMDSAGDLAGLAAMSLLASRGINSGAFLRGNQWVKGAGTVGLRAAPAGIGALNSMKDSVKMPSGFEPGPNGVPYMEIHGTGADAE